MIRYCIVIRICRLFPYLHILLTIQYRNISIYLCIHFAIYTMSINQVTHFTTIIKHAQNHSCLSSSGRRNWRVMLTASGLVAADSHWLKVVRRCPEEVVRQCPEAVVRWCPEEVVRWCPEAVVHVGPPAWLMLWCVTARLGCRYQCAVTSYCGSGQGFLARWQ